ncbi:MAG: hypothetical protein HOY75_10035 [Streptomyces sp.]|nr:hypothetical protein [Streptomyces sp.]
MAESDAVLVVDETGDPKKGKATVGVQRQYTGTARWIEHCRSLSNSPTRPAPRTR